MFAGLGRPTRGPSFGYGLSSYLPVDSVVPQAGLVSRAVFAGATN